MSTDTMYLDNLDEFVNDENKVVTYKWLSQTLQVHVNQAKQMLYAFVQQQRNQKDNDSIHVTYFVAGTGKSNDGDTVMKCAVVPEEELETFKSSLDQVTSSHIFSVQKVKLKDSSPLYITDYSALKENVFETNNFSSIIFKKAKLRTKEQLQKMVEVMTSKKEPVPPGGKAGASTAGANSGSRPGGGGPTPKPAPKGSIASMFAGAGASKKSEARGQESASAASSTAKASAKAAAPGANSKKGSVMSFFSNHTGKTNKPVEKSIAPAKKTSPEPSVAKLPSAASKKTEVKKSTRAHNSDSEDGSPLKKKRRRIRAMSLSSSEDEIEVEEESPVPSPQLPPVLEPEEPIAMEVKEEPMEAAEDREEDEDVIPSTPQNGVKHRHFRRRKLVPKTYMDEDGFMVTEKVFESESASEVEEDPKPSEKPKPAAPVPKVNQTAPKKDSPPKKASPTKGNKKQMSLTSFFMKK